MDFWHFVWLMVWGFFFIVFLIILFQVIVDLFRDTDLSGGWKALWLIFLMVFPPLTTLVYLISRGKGMGERQAALAQASKQATDDYIRSVSAPTDPAAQIEKAKALLDAGSITQAEYDQLKAKALA